MSCQHVCRLCLVVTALFLNTAYSHAQAEAVRWRHNIDAAKIEAIQTGKLVLLHFGTRSCGPCRKLDSEVFSQPRLGEMLEQNFVPVKIDADMSPALAGSFNIDRVPTDVVLTPQGNVVAKLSCPPTAAGYGNQLANLSHHYRQQSLSRNTPAQTPVQAAYAGLQIGQYNNAQVATTPSSTQSAQATPAAGPPVIAPSNGPQVTHNAYASATPNFQAPAKPVVAAPGSYTNQHVAAPPALAKQPATVQTTSARTSLPSAPSTMQGPSGSQVAATTAGSALAAPVVPPQLPEGSPPIAFEGFCPVTLKQARKWVIGDLKYGAIHRGRTYLFTGDTQRQQFLTNPDAFSPVFSGIDAVKLLDENKTVEGNRRFGFEYRGAFYLFSNQESMARFANQPDLYAAGVRQAMTRMDAIGQGTLRR